MTVKGAKSAKSINKLSSLILIIEARSTERDGSIYNEIRKYEIHLFRLNPSSNERLMSHRPNQLEDRSPDQDRVDRTFKASASCLAKLHDQNCDTERSNSPRSNAAHEIAKSYRR